MTPIYKSKFFKLEELISRTELAKMRKVLTDDQIWSLWDWRILLFADLLRLKFGPLICNTKQLQHRGYREPSYTEGAVYSQHRFFKALDLQSPTIPAEEMREWIRDNYKNMITSLFSYDELKSIGLVDIGTIYIFGLITTIEKGVAWLHFDSRNIQGLYEVSAS